MALLLAASVAPLQAQGTHPLAGVWRASDASITVQILACPGADLLCATLIDETSVQGQRSRVGSILVRDIRSAGARGWVGRYVEDGENLPAQIRLPSSNAATFKICTAAFLCETLRFTRVT